MRPTGLKTRIFLDSGDPKETGTALAMMGFLDGQTTNPSLIAKNPATTGKKFSKDQLLDFYRGVVQEVSALIPQGSVSIEVYADSETLAETMLEQGRLFWQWIPNAHIKFPTTQEGLKAAALAVKEGLRVNMTLVFSQEQAAAVYAATLGAKRGDVFLSPFIGRLDDRGENGMDLIANIIEMYKHGDGHVEVLTASVRGMSHLNEAVRLGSDILTAPFALLKEWAGNNLLITDLPYQMLKKMPVKPIPYIQLDLTKDWRDYNIHHELTEKGIEKFAADWNNLIA